jgi:hypothetical protein
MAVSGISGDFGFVTQISVILKEGNTTYNSSGFGPYGKVVINTVATEICQGDPVALSTDTANTYAATGGLFVVAPLANDVHLAIGKIIDEPKWVRQPTASQSTWADMLTNKYYRIATLQLFIPMTVMRATIVCANASAITPGTAEKIDIDASASQAAHGLSVIDVASGGATGVIPLTYVAQSASATVDVLLGFTGFGTVTT